MVFQHGWLFPYQGGFNDSNYFTRQFSKIFGQSPKA
ncbi:AraC family transcriptional regulator [Paenibacillus sp. Y412MC10]